jgi:cell division protease FtsH
MQRAEKILKDNIDTMHKLAEVLLEREILDAEEIDLVMQGKKLPPVEKENNNSNLPKDSKTSDNKQNPKAQDTLALAN